MAVIGIHIDVAAGSLARIDKARKIVASSPASATSARRVLVAIACASIAARARYEHVERALHAHAGSPKGIPLHEQHRGAAIAIAAITARSIGIAALAVNGAICLVLIAVTIAGSLGPLTPQSDPLRRLRGWQQLADDTATALSAHGAQTVVADRRAAAALLNWHFHENGVEVLIHDADGIPSNHFETNTPWTPRPGRRLVALSGRSEPPAMEDVAWPDAGGPPVSDTPISRNRNRTLYLHSGIEAD